jgi:hypothetical protein
MSPCSPRGLGEVEVGSFSFRLEEVYVFQSTGGSGLCERLMVITGWGCKGPSCTLTSCCTGGIGDFRKLPGLCAANTIPQRKEKKEGFNSCCCRPIVVPQLTLETLGFTVAGEV